MALARKSTTLDVFRDTFHLTGSFRIAEIYNPDNPGLYVREMYGKQLEEFHKRFFIDPLDRDFRSNNWSDLVKPQRGQRRPRVRQVDDDERRK